MVYGAHVVHHDRRHAYVLLRSWQLVTTDTVASRAAHAAYCGYPDLASNSRPPQAAAHHTGLSDHDSGAPAHVTGADHLTVLRAQAAEPLLPILPARYTDRPATCSPCRTRGAAPPIQRPRHDALVWLRAVPGPRTLAPAVPVPEPWQRAEMPAPCVGSPGAAHVALYRRSGDGRRRPEPRVCRGWCLRLLPDGKHGHKTPGHMGQWHASTGFRAAC